ncbi:MAG TPA: beta-galactosidase, partial [Anaerolineaceae bacterium]|nr:beta-galactosidase [Anaerolineaceae bacterium]
MKLGVCYYPEHWPQERWAEDARMMRAAGLDYVRVGEFAWGLMEPEEGRFDWAWLDQAIQTLVGEGLKIVLCTPTAAPPAWLSRGYPQTLPVDAQGRTRQFGSRRHYCANSPEYQQHTRRIVTAMGERYGAHPALVAWQIDNEFDCHNTARCYCPRCAAAFRVWLQRRYGTLAALNEAWGAAFWSQTYSDWEQIEIPSNPVADANCSQALDFIRFSSDSVVAYQQLQLDLLRKLTDRRICTNLMGDLPYINYYDLGKNLDFIAWDSYPTGFAEKMAPELYHPGQPRPAGLAFDLGDPYVTQFHHDLTRGLNPAPYWVMEQQAGGINWGKLNPGVRPGAVRLWTWQALASGTEAVMYFRWRACLYAQEQYHSGLLHHDASPDLGYREVLGMLPERVQMAEIAAEAMPAPQVALLSDYDDLWALQMQPHRQDYAYARAQFRLYGALQRLGIPCDIVSPRADLSRYALVLAPSLMVVDEGVSANLRAYVQGGGNLVLGVRSGFKTASNKVTDLPLPGLLRDIAGVTVTDWHALPPEVGYGVAGAAPVGQATFWAERLIPTEGGRPAGRPYEIIPHFTYNSGPFDGATAFSEHAFGQGRCFYWGWYPTPEQAGMVLGWLAQRLGLERLAELPEGVIVQRRGKYTLLFN